MALFYHSRPEPTTLTHARSDSPAAREQAKPQPDFSLSLSFYLSLSWCLLLHYTYSRSSRPQVTVSAGFEFPLPREKISSPSSEPPMAALRLKPSQVQMVASSPKNKTTCLISEAPSRSPPRSVADQNVPLWNQKEGKRTSDVDPWLGRGKGGISGFSRYLTWLQVGKNFSVQSDIGTSFSRNAPV